MIVLNRNSFGTRRPAAPPVQETLRGSHARQGPGNRFAHKGVSPGSQPWVPGRLSIDDIYRLRRFQNGRDVDGRRSPASIAASSISGCSTDMKVTIRSPIISARSRVSGSIG